MAGARARYYGLRRNALCAVCAAQGSDGGPADAAARTVVERLADDPAPGVADAARWAGARLRGSRD